MSEGRHLVLIKKSESNTSVDSDNLDDLSTTQIREDLREMSFADLLALKEELGSKVYNEAIFGEESEKNTEKAKYKRENKNRPREMSSKRQVPFLKNKVKQDEEIDIRDPRFDEKCGEFNSRIFKNNYEFISDIREREIKELKKKMKNSQDGDEKQNIRLLMQKLENQNREERKRKQKEEALKEEKLEIQKALQEGRTPYFPKKKERKAKELIEKFLELKNSGKLAKHLEKRRKKNASKDRKRLNFN